MNETSKLIGDENSTNTLFLEAGQMYIFHPEQHYSRLTLYKTKSTADPGVIMKRTAVLVVLKREGTWRFVHCLGHQGWINVSDDYNGSKIFEHISSFRRHQDFRGNNMFLMGGRLMVGSDGKAFIATNFMAVVVLVLFCVYMAPLVPYSNVFMALGSALWAITMVNLWLVAFVEPGIIPRLPPHQKPQPPKNGITSVGWKYCKICNILRPPQVKHCKACQNCVHGFDHHCPYTTNCIGVRNRQYFLIFVVCMNLFLLLLVTAGAWVLTLSALRWHSGAWARDVEEAIVKNGVLSVVSLAAFLSLFLFLPFCRYHLHIVAIGETTFEHIKHIYKDQINPNHHGVCGNYALLCCTSKQASLLPNMSEEVTVEQYLQENVDPLEWNHLFYGQYGSVFEDVLPTTMAGTESI